MTISIILRCGLSDGRPAVFKAFEREIIIKEILRKVFNGFEEAWHET